MFASIQSNEKRVRDLRANAAANAEELIQLSARYFVDQYEYSHPCTHGVYCFVVIASRSNIDSL
ncbi:hypothetical protein EON65_52895 [archaeon]|nr:MAG: hypothetical protein EON65_52895 [archaeon]